MGVHYKKHPDTNFDLIGYQIPRWEEAKSLSKELALVLPDNHYCGWDLVLTDEGWVLQEANDRGNLSVFNYQPKKDFVRNY